MHILGLISGVVILINHILMYEKFMSPRDISFNLINAITCTVFTLECFQKGLYDVGVIDLFFVLVAVNNIIRKIKSEKK